MSQQEIKEVLEKQLQLLSQHSETADGYLLIELSKAMETIAKLLLM